MKTKLFITLQSLLFVLLASFNTHADTLEQEIQEYQAIFKTNFAAANNLMGELAWKGISDARVFDPLLQMYNEKKQATDKRSKKETLTLAKGLTYSGNKKYRAVIAKDMETGDAKQQKYYAKFLDDFDRYAKWNPEISKNVASAKDADKQRIINTLKSNNPELREIGAKRLSRTHIGDQALLDLADKRLQETYKSAESSEEVSAAAEIAKTLKDSGNSKYKSTLEKVANDAPNKKLKKYAAKFLTQM